MPTPRTTWRAAPTTRPSRRSSGSKAAPPARCWRSRPQLDLAYAQYRSGERAAALATLDRFIKLHPSSPALDYALYLRGLVNFNDNLGFLGSLAQQDLSERDQQASRDAYQSFSQLVTQFPQSRYAEDARARMDYIVNALAAYEVHVARYYFRRGAYRGGGQPRAAGGAGVPADAGHRRGALHHGARATSASGWSSCATTPSAC